MSDGAGFLPSTVLMIGRSIFARFENVILNHMLKRSIDSQLLERRGNHLISFGGENDNAEGKDV